MRNHSQAHSHKLAVLLGVLALPACNDDYTKIEVQLRPEQSVGLDCNSLVNTSDYKNHKWTWEIENCPSCTVSPQNSTTSSATTFTAGNSATVALVRCIVNFDHKTVSTTCNGCGESSTFTEYEISIVP